MVSCSLRMYKALISGDAAYNKDIYIYIHSYQNPVCHWNLSLNKIIIKIISDTGLID